MKSLLIVVAAVFVAFSSGAKGLEKAKPGAKNKSAPVTATKPKPAPPEQKIQYTGSFIPQNVRQSGYVTDARNPLYVIDSNSIRNSGASDLRQLLARPGFNH